MIVLKFENNQLIIEGEKEDFQHLEGYNITSGNVLSEGGLSICTKQVVFKIITDIDKLVNNVIGNDFITDYRLLFPEGESEIYEKNFRGNLKQCIHNMNKFKKEFKFTNEEILQATKNMIERHIAKGKKDWIPQAHYFIYKKDRGSDLATECENLKNGTSTGVFNKWK